MVSQKIESFGILGQNKKKHEAIIIAHYHLEKISMAEARYKMSNKLFDRKCDVYRHNYDVQKCKMVVILLKATMQPNLCLYKAFSKPIEEFEIKNLN